MTKLARLLVARMGSHRVGIRIPGPDREKRRVRKKINAAWVAGSARALCHRRGGRTEELPRS